MDDGGRSLQHTHSIVLRIDSGAQFDLDALLTVFPSTSLVASLQEDFQKFYSPWTMTSAALAVRKLNAIFHTLDHYVVQHAVPTPTTIFSRLQYQGEHAIVARSNVDASKPARTGSGDGRA